MPFSKVPFLFAFLLTPATQAKEMAGEHDEAFHGTGPEPSPGDPHDS